MIKAAIIDDEDSGRNVIRQYLSLYFTDIEVIGEASSVKSGVKLLSKQTPDIVFLDIQMQDGTGFNLLELLPQRSFKVIFVTSFDQFALKAIKYSAADYLLKPVDPDMFVDAVEKVKTDFEKPAPAKDARIDELLTNINSFSKIGLPTNDGIQFVKVDDVVRCEADGAYTVFILENGQRIMVSKSLKTYEELFADRKFLRVHKSYLINTRYVEKYINGDGGSVVMTDGATVEVSRRKKDELLNMML